MLVKFKKLEKLYFQYEKTISLKNRINLINKIDFLEREILSYLDKEKEEFVKYIIFNIYKKTDFIFGRYLFFLYQINIYKKYEREILDIYLKVLEKYKDENERKDAVYYSIKGLEKFISVNFEEKMIYLSKHKIYSLYKKEFIILFGKTKGTIKTINFLEKELKMSSDFSKEIYWSIGMVASYKNYPMIKRRLLNDYLKRRIRSLKNLNREKDMLYFSLIEIFFIQNGIDGKIINKILEILQQNKDKTKMEKILINVINNSNLSEEEKSIIINIENLF